MALQAVLRSSEPSARLLSAALWHTTKTDLCSWLVTAAPSEPSTPASGASGSLHPVQPAQSQAPPCSALTIAPPYIRAAADVTPRAGLLLPFVAAAASRHCQPQLLQHPGPPAPCSSIAALLTFNHHHQPVSTSTKPPQLAASVAPVDSVHAKRPQKPAATAGGSAAHAATDGKAAVGGSGSGGGVSSVKGAARAKGDPVKELHIKPRIAEHDLSYRLRQVEGWLADGLRVKLVVEFRGAEQSEAAAALTDSVVGRLGGRGQPMAPRQQLKGSWFVILRPLAPPKQPKQQQSERQQQQQERVGVEDGAAGSEGAVSSAA